MQTLKPTLTIDIWSDLVCPWCWIAKKRFEQGLNRFEFRDQVVIRHHSYRLAGGTPAMPFKDAIVKKLGSQHSAELMMNQVGTAGKSESPSLSLRGGLPVSAFPWTFLRSQKLLPRRSQRPGPLRSVLQSRRAPPVCKIPASGSHQNGPGAELLKVPLSLLLPQV